MTMFNPTTLLAKSKGIDLPIMYWYLAGYMSGEQLEKCMSWRKAVRKRFEDTDGLVEELRGLNTVNIKKAD